MPKINVVDFNSPSEPTDPTNEAAEMSKLHEALRETHEEAPKPRNKKATKVVESEPDEPIIDEPVITKEKKRKPKKVVEPPPVKEESESSIEEPVINEPVIEEVKPEAPPETNNKNIKVTELHKCPDCGKEMTKKSLRYSHAKNCPAQKPKQQPKAKATPKPSKKPPVNEDVESDIPYDIPEEVIEKVIYKRMETAKNNRIQRKQENIKRLALHIA